MKLTAFLNKDSLVDRLDIWFERNWPQICIVFFIGWMLALTIGIVVIATNQARISAQQNSLRIQQLTNAERINSIADEQSWVREQKQK